MKTRLFLFLLLMAFTFVGCNLTSSSESTPVIVVANPTSNRVDTLNSYLTDQAGVYRLDTINVGDTITFRIVFYGYSNNLVSCNVTQSDSTSTKLLFPAKASLDSVFVSATSDYSIGKFIFKNKTSTLYLPFKYVAKKASKDAKITFSVVSDANFSNLDSQGTNYATYVLNTPIKLPKQATAN